MKDVFFPLLKAPIRLWGAAGLLKAPLRLWGAASASEEGQSMVEYAFILAFIAVLVVASLMFLQPGVNVLLNQVSNGFKK